MKEKEKVHDQAARHDQIKVVLTMLYSTVQGSGSFRVVVSFVHELRLSSFIHFIRRYVGIYPDEPLPKSLRLWSNGELAYVVTQSHRLPFDTYMLQSRHE